MSKLKIYTKSILIPVLLGIVVGFITYQSLDYTSLEKPFLAPPSILFPIVWSILYVLMGVAYGILESNSLNDSYVTSVYYTQLFVNLLWPIFFFTLKWRLFSFFWIILLSILVLIIIIRFYKKNKLSGLLQIPYFLWCLFATYLNFSIYLINR